jgi:hypothetical protein
LKIGGIALVLLSSVNDVVAVNRKLLDTMYSNNFSDFSSQFAQFSSIFKKYTYETTAQSAA